MLLPSSYWCKCNPGTLSAFSDIIQTTFPFPFFFLALLMNSVTACKNERLGSIPITKYFFNCSEILSCLLSATVLGSEGGFFMKFQGYRFVRLAYCPLPSLHVGLGSFLAVCYCFACSSEIKLVELLKWTEFKITDTLLSFAAIICLFWQSVSSL